MSRVNVGKMHDKFSASATTWRTVEEYALDIAQEYNLPTGRIDPSYNNRYAVFFGAVRYSQYFTTPREARAWLDGFDKALSLRTQNGEIR